MEENGSALSQDAIDTLLNSQGADDPDENAQAAQAVPAEAAPTPEVAAAASEAVVPPPEPAQPPATPVAPVSPPVTISAPPPPGVTPPPGVVHQPPAAAPAPEPVIQGISEQQAMAIAGGAAESAVAPVRDNVGAISGRVDALEAALAKISQLEAEIGKLKAGSKATQVNSGLTVEDVKPLVDRVLGLEAGAKNSPLFNLYEKFECTACGNHGAAQARARCGSCGKEGWFGRKEAPADEEAA